MLAHDMTTGQTPRMAFHCPECQEAQVEYVGATEDAKTLLRCRLCVHEWAHGGERPVPRDTTIPYEQAKATFPRASDVTPAAAARVEKLRAEFLRLHPDPEPGVAEFWAHYQQLFSEQGLPTAPSADLKLLANTETGARPGNMSVFNRAWNARGDEAAAERFRGVVEFLLRGPADLPLEDRLTRLIDPEDPIGMTGFRESLLSKVLCIMEPSRFLPVLIYTSPAGGKREIAKSVFGLELPPPERTSMTRGRLACWSNDLLVECLGGSFANLAQAAWFLWWAKDHEA
ncbi:MAG: hypothetical protein JWP14_1572 [Frankiales bacterium]|nr:hypothetical protein [Frankiales bacterium]